MSFPASHTVNNRDVWWFICKRWWRGKCSVLQTRARIHLFSRVMSSKVCPLHKGHFPAVLARRSQTAAHHVSDAIVALKSQLRLWMWDLFTLQAMKSRSWWGESVFAQLEIMQIWWSCKVKAVLCHLALSTATGKDILILQCFTVSLDISYFSCVNHLRLLRLSNTLTSQYSTIKSVCSLINASIHLLINHKTLQLNFDLFCLVEFHLSRQMTDNDLNRERSMVIMHCFGQIG